MRRWLAIACVVGGCWRNEPPVAPTQPPEPAADPPQRFTQGIEPGSFQGVMVKMGEFRDKMCSCHDKTCVDAVTDEMTKWSVEVANRSSDVKPSEEQTKEISAVVEEFAKCMTAAMTAPPSTGTP
jgi:hypothetical protein